LVGRKPEKLRLLKILPPKKTLERQQTAPLNTKTTVKILPKNKIRVIDKENEKKSKEKNS
jgi:hypothetical protein